MGRRKRRLTRKGHERTFWSDGNVLEIIWIIWITWVCAFVKIHQTVHDKVANFIV